MKKYLLLIICSIFLSACSAKNYNVKKYKNEIPKWYVEDKKVGKKVFGKAMAQSDSLEIATRKAEGLAVSNIILKLKSEIDVLKEILIKEEIKRKNNSNFTEGEEKINEKITQLVSGFQITDYRVSNKVIYKDKDFYKVFVEIEFNTKELFDAIEKIS